MQKFDVRKFLEAMDNRTKGHTIPKCPYCGNSKYSTSSQVAHIIVNETVDEMGIGKGIPSGMIICKNCGHIDFFAIGALGLLNQGQEENHDENK